MKLQDVNRNISTVYLIKIYYYNVKNYKYLGICIFVRTLGTVQKTLWGEVENCRGGNPDNDNLFGGGGGTYFAKF